ncbi:MAG TPA: flagellar motor protein [Solirubrobacterales bacterium]|nr:flagellar motor protein [Solirubrobacterales bacterium]
MKANTAIGIGAGIFCLLLSVMMEGGNPAALIGIPPFLIVVGGTGCATFASTTLEQMKRIPALYKKAFRGNALEPHVAIQRMVALADKARRDGLLALEDDLAEVEDEFTRKGVQLVVDGTDSDLIRAILQSEVDGMASRHRSNAHVFATAGGFAPTLGIIGTVLSLVHVLENLSNPGNLGHSIAGAFIATLYGVGSANLIFLPVANKLKELSGEELLYREMQLEAILSIQAGDNPRMLGETLETFLAPADRGKEAEEKAAAAAEQMREAA